MRHLPEVRSAVGWCTVAPMERNLPRIPDDQFPGASRRWPRQALSSAAEAAPQWRYLIAIAAIILLVALAGASPQV